MAQLKAINNQIFLNNLKNLEDVFKDIKQSIKEVITEEPSIEFQEIIEINDIIKKIRETSSNMKRAILINNIKLEPLENAELVAFCNKTGFTRDDLQRVITLANDINAYDLEKDFNKNKDVVIKKIAEKEKEAAIKAQELILEKLKKEEFQKKTQLEEEKNITLKIDRNIFDEINNLDIVIDGPTIEDSNNYEEEIILTNYLNDDEISFNRKK